MVTLSSPPPATTGRPGSWLLLAGAGRHYRPRANWRLTLYMGFRFRLLTLCVTPIARPSSLSRLRVSRKAWLMAKMGRPKVAERDYRGEFITVRLRPGEKRAILQAARKAGERHTNWTRNALLSAARRALRQ